MPRLLTAWCFAFALVVWPAAAVADDATGGTAPPSASPQTPSDEMPVDAPHTALVGRRVRIGGKARRARRKVVRIEGRVARGPWAVLVRARATRAGAFTAV